MRKREVFKDLVNLAADDSGRRPELYVVGKRPIQFLQTTRSTAEWGLDRSPGKKALFAQTFGSLATPISTFTSSHGARVSIVDIRDVVPDFPVGMD